RRETPGRNRPPHENARARAGAPADTPRGAPPCDTSRASRAARDVSRTSSPARSPATLRESDAGPEPAAWAHVERSRARVAPTLQHREAVRPLPPCVRQPLPVQPPNAGSLRGARPVTSGRPEPARTRGRARDSDRPARSRLDD